MNTDFEDVYRTLQNIEDAIDSDSNFMASLSEREQMCAGRVAMIAKRLAQKIEDNK